MIKNISSHTHSLHEIFSEIENNIEIIQKQARSIYNVYYGKLRLHMNSGTMDSEDFIQSEKEWNAIDQELKTLEQIKYILKNHSDGFGGIKDPNLLDKELLNYINIATEKQLHNIADTFNEYRSKFMEVLNDIDELIKLKAKPESNSTYIKETFLTACQNLDASIFEPLIDEDQYFEDIDKYRFLQSMKEQFDYLKGIGINKVQMVKGICRMCFNGDKVYEFYKEPKVGKPAFAYNIKEVNGFVKDIFRCNYSDGYERAARENRDPDITYLY